jgi:putative transposase
LGEVFKHLAEQKENWVEEGQLRLNHAHAMISIPPKCAYSQVVGFIKGKSAIPSAHVFGKADLELRGHRMNR